MVVVSVLTVDHLRVSEDELFAAVDGAATQLDGSPGVGPFQIEDVAKDELGHELTWDNVILPDDDTEDFQSAEYYEFMVSEGDKAVVCVTITNYREPVDSFPSASASTGACEDA